MKKSRKFKQKCDVKEIPVNRFLLPVLFIVFSLILEITNFLWLGFKTSGGAIQAFPTAWMFDIGAILIIAGLIYIVSNKHAMLAIFYIFIILQVVVNLISANIFNVFGDIFTIDYLFLGQEAAAAVRAEFIDFWSIALYIGILAVIITITVLLYKKNKLRVRLKHTSNWAFGLVLLILCEACGGALLTIQYKTITQAQTETIENNTSYLWDSLQFKLEAYKQFGFYGIYSKNIYDAIKGRKELDYGEDVELVNYINEGKTQNKNAILKDDNVILILCESIDDFAYDPILTPNMWELLNGKACNFTNFYGNNKTNYSEGIVIAGNMPKEQNLHTLVSKYGYDYAYTMPKMFKKAHSGETVTTSYFHANDRSFYQREIDYTETGFGFDNFFGIEDYTEKLGWFGDWVSDEAFFEYFADEFVPAEGKFMTSFATMSTHGPYTYENPRFKELYAKYDANEETFKAWFNDYFEDYGYSIPDNKADYEQFRRYKSALIDFDNFIGALFEELESKGHLQDTTIVMYADHNCYYDNMSFKVKNISKTDYANSQAHHIPLLIYNSKLEGGEFDQFCNTYDIYPTICELHGFEYNKNLTQGYNLLSDEIENSFFASHKGGMFDSNFYSSNIADLVPLVEDYVEEDVISFKTKAELYYRKQAKIDLIYMYNLAKDA